MGKVDRRSFLKSALKAGFCVGAYPIVTYAQSMQKVTLNKGVQKYVTGCMWCQNGCSMIVYVKNGKIIHLTGNPDDPVTKGNICIKPLGSVDFLNSKHRLLYPLKRVGVRGDKASFVKISWEQALDEIAEKLKKIRARYGGEALGIWASGRSAADGRKLNKAFAKLYGTPNYEKTGPFCNYSGKPAGISVIGTRHTPWVYSDDDFYNADLYVLIGSNMAATRPVSFAVLKERKKQNKCKIVVIDPRRSESAREANDWIAIKPGRDLALGLGLLHYIISKDLVDKDFIQKYCLGYEQLKKEILAENYDLAWTSKITGIPANKIAELAHEYVSTRKAIVVGNAGLSHHTNAVQTHRVFYMLAAITGHFGEKAMGYGCLNNGGISTGSLPILDPYSKPKQKELCKNPVGWLESLESSKYPYQLKALITTGSPLTQWPEQSRLRQLISKLELSVYNELVPNINAYYFDYILPAATWLEAGGLAPVSDDSRFVWVPKVIDPPGEAKPDRWWWIELGKRMGWGKTFRDELKDPVVLQNTVGRKKGFSVDNFLQQKDNALTAPIKVVNGKIVQRGTLFLDKKFPTKSKKIELWTSSLESKFSAYGLSAIPKYYTDPDLAVKREPTIVYNQNLIPSPLQKNKCYTSQVMIKKQDQDRHGFFLITGRPSVAIMGHTSHWIKILNAVSPDQFCLIHPNTAKKIGIKTNDLVLVSSSYGQTEAKAIVREDIREDTVFVPYSYGEKAPFTSWKSINFVTNMDARCPIAGQIAFKGTRVTIHKKV